MKKLLILLISCISYAQTINYTEDTSVIFNPERGWQKYTDNNSTLSSSTLNSWKNGVDKVSVIYRGFYLNNFINSNISQSYLDGLQADFNLIRNAEMKVLVRFSYTQSTSCTTCQPTKAQILSHIQQLLPVLNANKDVIFALQIGFIGAYGEWYYTNSTEFGNQSYTGYTNAQWQNRKEICDALLNNTDIQLQLRYPYAKNKMYGNNYLENAGYFNDAFLNIYGDEGFFPIGQNATPSQTQINEVLQQTVSNSMVGETNGLNTPRTDCTNAVAELNLYNYTLLNRDYYLPVINNWVSQGCYDQITKSLGYRFIMKSATFTSDSHNLHAELSVRNDGFTTPFKKRNVFLVFKNVQTGVLYKYLINTDIKTWFYELTVPTDVDTSTLPDGNYTTYLYLPDNNLTSSNYAIRLANLNMWDSTNGLNNLNYQFVKSPLGISEFTPLKKEVKREYYTIDGKYLGESAPKIKNIVMVAIITFEDCTTKTLKYCGI